MGEGEVDGDFGDGGTEEDVFRFFVGVEYVGGVEAVGGYEGIAHDGYGGAGGEAVGEGCGFFRSRVFGKLEQGAGGGGIEDVSAGGAHIMDAEAFVWGYVFDFLRGEDGAQGSIFGDQIEREGEGAVGGVIVGGYDGMASESNFLNHSGYRYIRVMYMVPSRRISAPHGRRSRDCTPAAARTAAAMGREERRNVPPDLLVGHTRPSWAPVYVPARSLT